MYTLLAFRKHMSLHWSNFLHCLSSVGKCGLSYHGFFFLNAFVPWHLYSHKVPLHSPSLLLTQSCCTHDHICPHLERPDPSPSHPDCTQTQRSWCRSPQSESLCHPEECCRQIYNNFMKNKYYQVQSIHLQHIVFHCICFSAGVIGDIFCCVSVSESPK